MAHLICSWLLCSVPGQKMPQIPPLGHQGCRQTHDISVQKPDHLWKLVPVPNRWENTTRTSYKPCPWPSFCKKMRQTRIPSNRNERSWGKKWTWAFLAIAPSSKLDGTPAFKHGNWWSWHPSLDPFLQLTWYTHLPLPTWRFTSHRPRITPVQKPDCLCLLSTLPVQKNLHPFSMKSPIFSFHSSLHLLTNSAIAAVHGSSPTFVCVYIFQLFP